MACDDCEPRKNRRVITCIRAVRFAFSPFPSTCYRAACSRRSWASRMPYRALRSVNRRIPRTCNRARCRRISARFIGRSGATRKLSTLPSNEPNEHEQAKRQRLFGLFVVSYRRCAAMKTTRECAWASTWLAGVAIISAGNQRAPRAAFTCQRCVLHGQEIGNRSARCRSHDVRRSGGRRAARVARVSRAALPAASDIVVTRWSRNVVIGSRDRS